MKTFPTRESFRAALGCAKSTMSRYLARDDFPVRRSPPWTQADAEVVLSWRADCLQENRDWTRERAPDPPATITLEAALARIDHAALTDPACPMNVSRWLGPTLAMELTLANLIDLAAVHRYGLACAMLAQAQAEGAKGLAAVAPADYYSGLMHRALTQRAKETVATVNKLLMGWTADRFKARKGWQKIIQRESAA